MSVNERYSLRNSSKPTDVRWTSIVSGTRQPSTSNSEHRARVQESRDVLARTMGVANWLEGIPQVIDDPKEFIAEVKKHPHVWDQLSKAVLEEIRPTNEELLEFKDILMIPDAKWAYVVTTFKLSNESNLYYIRQLRLQKTKQRNLKPTCSGAFRNIVPILEESIRRAQPKNDIINIKISFDACRMTKLTEQVVGTVSRVEEGSNYKSPFNADQVVLWLGHETYEDYERELDQLIPEVNKLIADDKITVDSKQYTVRPYLVVDMKSLCVLLGLYEVYRSNCNFRCCWCEITDDKMADFSQATWPFRDIATMKELAKTKKKPGDRTGIKVC